MTEFAQVEARLAWAQGHRTRLQLLVDAYRRLPPFAISYGIGGDGSNVVTAELTHAAPPEIALQVSDMAHQYRATLDNLVGAIRVDGPSRQSAFPIAASREQFKQQAATMLDGVPNWARDVVEMFQPFPDSQLGWLGEYLRLLHDLARQDRHRALPVHASIVEADGVEARLGEERTPIVFKQDGLTRAQIVYGSTCEVDPHFGVNVLVSGLTTDIDPEVLGVCRAIDMAVVAVMNEMRRVAKRETERMRHGRDATHGEGSRP